MVQPLWAFIVRFWVRLLMLTDAVFGALWRRSAEPQVGPCHGALVGALGMPPHGLSFFS